MKNNSVRAFSCLGAFLTLASTVGAQTFYLSTGNPTPSLNKMVYSGSGTPPTPTLIGVQGNRGAFGSPTWDPANSTMYYVNGSISNTSSLYTLDLTTGAATFLAGTAAPGINQLAYDTLNGKFYGFDGVNLAGGNKMGLYEIGLNGSSTLLTNKFTLSISALTYNPVIDKLIAGVANGGLYEIDPNNYQITQLSTHSGASDTCWYTYDPASGNYFGLDNARNFFEIDSSTYAVTSLSTSLTVVRPNGLALIPSVPEPGTLSLAAAGLVSLAGVGLRRRKQG